VKKLTKYDKKIKIRPNLSKEFQIMFEGLIKNWGKKTKKQKNSSPRAVVVALGEEMHPRVRDSGTRGRFIFPKCGSVGSGEEFLKKKRESLPRVLWAGTRGRN
jgi:hypothetical protein